MSYQERALEIIDRLTDSKAINIRERGTLRRAILLPERPQGEWIDEGQYAEGHSEHAYICKNCGYQIIVNPNMIFEERYCKYCGADMKGGAE